MMKTKKIVRMSEGLSILKKESKETELPITVFESLSSKLICYPNGKVIVLENGQIAYKGKDNVSAINCYLESLGKNKSEANTAFGDEWKLKLHHIPKVVLIDHFASQMIHKSILPIGSQVEVSQKIEEILVEYRNGNAGFDETASNFRDLIDSTMGVFWNNAVNKIKENPRLLKR